MDKINKMKAYVQRLNQANKAYYQDSIEIMSNKEYDHLYDQLLDIEKEIGLILSDSPTRHVGYQVVSHLPKESHQQKMLSLDKTKDVQALFSWLGNEKGLLSWKLDGLTIVLSYNNGQLEKAVTRGNGEIGEVITNNAFVFSNLPIQIAYKGSLILRGEAVIKYSDFNRINEALPPDEKYKNPRNLCSGTVRQLNNEITASRNVHFFAFQLVQAEGLEIEDSKIKQLEWLDQIGFEVVEHVGITQSTILEQVNTFESKIGRNDFGSDGLVLTYDSISLSQSLGSTSKFPRDSLAFKWKDEMKETKLIDIEWSASRTGLINPIALLEPVDLEGTTVSRASVHNISILEELELGIGDTVLVYKANMIIPQIADNLTRSNDTIIPEKCPVCGEKTELREVNGIKALYCTNAECSAKHVKAFSHFVSRDGMNIEGLSEATLQKFIQQGFIHELGDIFRLADHKDEIIALEGFGQKSYQNLIQSIEKSKDVQLANFIYALGIQNVGLSNARLLCQFYHNDFDAILQTTKEDLQLIEGYGVIIANAIFDYFNYDKNKKVLKDLLSYLKFKKNPSKDVPQALEGKVFVITGHLEHYENRKTLKEEIESHGGKVTGSVSSNTDYLINNNHQSTSSKNKKAMELGIPILSEEDFITLLKS